LHKCGAAWHGDARAASAVTAVAPWAHQASATSPRPPTGTTRTPPNEPLPPCALRNQDDTTTSRRGGDPLQGDESSGVHEQVRGPTRARVVRGGVHACDART
jgi:hypothetical protein